jgi:hypothetical protein
MKYDVLHYIYQHAVELCKLLIIVVAGYYWIIGASLLFWDSLKTKIEFQQC